MEKKIELLTGIREIYRMQMGNKLSGRRNWVISFDNSHATLFTYGRAKELGALRLYLSDIINCGEGLFYFTYKKDAYEMLSKMEENGWKVQVCNW